MEKTIRLNTLTILILGSFNNHVRPIHESIYSGKRDQNKYQITDNLFIDWCSGIMGLYNQETKQGVHVIQEQGEFKLKLVDTKKMSPRFAYVDIRESFLSSLKKGLAVQIVKSYESQNKSLFLFVEMKLQTIFDLFK